MKEHRTTRLRRLRRVQNVLEHHDTIGRRRKKTAVVALVALQTTLLLLMVCVQPQIAVGHQHSARDERQQEQKFVEIVEAPKHPQHFGW